MKEFLNLNQARNDAKQNNRVVIAYGKGKEKVYTTVKESELQYYREYYEVLDGEEKSKYFLDMEVKGGWKPVIDEINAILRELLKIDPEYDVYTCETEKATKVHVVYQNIVMDGHIYSTRHLTQFLVYIVDNPCVNFKVTSDENHIFVFPDKFKHVNKVMFNRARIMNAEGEPIHVQRPEWVLKNTLLGSQMAYARCSFGALSDKIINGITQLRSTSNLMDSYRAKVKHKDTIDGDEMVHTYDGRKRAENLEEGESVMCNKCKEFNMRTFVRKTSYKNTKGVYCFTCKKGSRLLDVAQQCHEANEREEFCCDDILTPELAGLKIQSKLHFVDSPTGKMQLYKEIIQPSTLIITFRRTLCTDLQTLDPEIVSYLDINWKNVPQKLVICVDSLMKLPKKGFDLVIVDECVSTTHQLVSVLRTDKQIKENMNKLAQICALSEGVVCFQHNITTVCIHYFKSICMVDRYILRKNTMLDLVPTDLYTNYVDIVSLMLDNYNKLLHTNSTKSYAVLCTSKAKAIELYLLHTILAKEMGLPCKVLLITSETITYSPQKDFIAHPNASNYDVVITTPLSQTQVGTRPLYVFINNGVLTIREVQQFLRRFSTPRAAWVEKSTSIEQVKDNRDYDRFIESSYRYSVAKEAREEERDSKNRMSRLFSGVCHQTGIISPKWILEKIDVIKAFTTTEMIKKMLVGSYEHDILMETGISLAMRNLKLPDTFTEESSVICAAVLDGTLKVKCIGTNMLFNSLCRVSRVIKFIKLASTVRDRYDEWKECTTLKDLSDKGFPIKDTMLLLAVKVADVYKLLNFGDGPLIQPTKSTPRGTKVEVVKFWQELGMPMITGVNNESIIKTAEKLDLAEKTRKIDDMLLSFASCVLENVGVYLKNVPPVIDEYLLQKYFAISICLKGADDDILSILEREYPTGVFDVVRRYLYMSKHLEVKSDELEGLKEDTEFTRLLLNKTCLTKNAIVFNFVQRHKEEFQNEAFMSPEVSSTEPRTPEQNHTVENTLRSCAPEVPCSDSPIIESVKDLTYTPKVSLFDDDPVRINFQCNPAPQPGTECVRPHFGGNQDTRSVPKCTTSVTVSDISPVTTKMCSTPKRQRYS